MMPTTIEWIEKAEEDFEAASILAQSRSERQLNTICFHCQQSAEVFEGHNAKTWHVCPLYS